MLSGKDICWVTHCVYAPADAARADIERAMLSKDFTKLKLISGPKYSVKYEFSSDGRFHSQGMKSSHLRKSPNSTSSDNYPKLFSTHIRYV